MLEVFLRDMGDILADFFLCLYAGGVDRRLPRTDRREISSVT